MLKAWKVGGYRVEDTDKKYIAYGVLAFFFYYYVNVSLFKYFDN